MKIVINNLMKKIKKNTILSNISMEMESGKIYGLQGINGSGKTMLLRTIIGLIHPSKGTITIDNRELGREIEFPDSIGFLLENPAFLDRYSGFDNLKMLASIKQRISLETIKETITSVGLNPDDKKKYRKYSLGMKQRLGIAAAIMESPDIVILDEPTNALDETGVKLVQELIFREKERGALVIVSCHDLEILKNISDEIFRLNEGCVIEHKINEGI